MPSTDFKSSAALPPRSTIKKLLLILSLGLGVFLPVGVRSAPGKIVSDKPGMDTAMMQLRQIASNPEFNHSLLSAAGRNLLNLARRWPTLTGELHTGAAQANGSMGPRFPDNLVQSRYSGFTQSESSTGWCGHSVVVAFNDTGAETTTLASGRGISQVGYAASDDRGHSFTYMGPLPTPSDPDTFIAGDPVVACANRQDFYVISTWLNGTEGVSGVSLSTSSDGGQTFSTPTLVVGKSSSDHIIDHPWIALDSNARNDMYVVYADLDFSGAVCGTAGGAPIPRYAIEVVSSADDGVTWSASPVVVQQVCADAAHAFAFVDGPQLAVGPQGQVYVAWEALGTSGGANDRKLAASSGPSRALEFAQSVDGATTFSAPVSITPVSCAGDCSDWQGFFHSNEYPSLAVGKGPHNSGVVYVAWNDGDRQVADSLSPTGTYDYTDILVTDSSDGGLTWSIPQQVNDNPEGAGAPLTDQFEPALGTDGTGQVAVCFYDRRNDRANFLIDRYCAYKSAEGWVNRRITAESFPVVVGEDILVAPDYMGDYDTLASDFTEYWPGFIGGFAANPKNRPKVQLNTYRQHVH